MCNPIHDNGTEPASFVFPASPNDATLQLTIRVEEVEGEGLLMGATLTPGGQTWGNGLVAYLFLQAHIVPQPGTYVFETSHRDTRFMSGPDAFTQADASDMAFFLMSILCKSWSQLVKALQAFPSTEAITQAACRIVGEITSGSIERSPLEVTSVVDARTTVVESVKCTTCGFGLSSGLVRFLAGYISHDLVIDDGIAEVGGIKFGSLTNQWGLP